MQGRLCESSRYLAGSESRERRYVWWKAGWIGTNECSKARRMYELLLECFQDVILNKGNYLSSVNSEWSV